MAEAVLTHEGRILDWTPAAARSSGEVVQGPDGRPGDVPVAVAAGEVGAHRVQPGVVLTVEKTASVAILRGGRVYWDHSANKAHFKKVNDRDFYLGRAVEDSAASATTVKVAVGVDPKPQIDLLRDGALSVATGTAAAGGFGLPMLYGGVPGLRLTATNEAQCVDLLSVDRVALSSNPIAEFVIRVGANGSTSDVDLNVGLANATSTTDADAIAESVFVHVDGGSLNLNVESDDGTTEVAATDSTVDFTAGSAVANRFEVWLDARDPADVQVYIDGVNVLPDSTFTLAAATGPIGLLVHLEKSSGTATAGPVYVDRAELRTFEE